MRLWEVTGWQDDEAPHWHVAYVEAESAERAMDILQARIGGDRSDRPETVYAPTDRERWRAKECAPGFIFILGGGCR